MPKFRKKPVVIEAVQFTGDNDLEIAAFTGEDNADPNPDDPKWYIYTLEGVMTADVGDWIIKGVQGEFYPCKPDIFEQTYEEVYTFIVDTTDPPEPPKRAEPTYG